MANLGTDEGFHSSNDASDYPVIIAYLVADPFENSAPKGDIPIIHVPGLWGDVSLDSHGYTLSIGMFEDTPKPSLVQ